MNPSNLVEEIRRCRVVAVVTLDRAANAVPLGQALAAGGVRAVELTLRTPEALEGLRRLAGVPGVLAGAGTVLDAQQIPSVVAAGARFAVSPGLNPTVVRAAQAAGLPFAPGVMTPSEVEQAMALGCRLLKFFPADVAGGPKMLKALAGPYGHTGAQFVPLGGLNPANAREYLDIPCVAAIGGSWIADRKLLAAGDFDAIRKLAAEAAALCGCG
jgi:2-dehydro-3-deoxyphosphogluconate aldolase/(4S)-4-hydroxy-2-oxoglutarate aldolase